MRFLSSCHKCFIFDWVNTASLFWPPGCHFFSRSQFWMFVVSCVWISPVFVCCVPNFVGKPHRMDGYYYCLYYYYYYFYTINIITVTVIITIIISSFYCYYYELQVNIPPLGPIPHGYSIAFPTTPETDWQQTIHWADRAKTCDFESSSCSSKLGCEILFWQSRL